MKFPSKNCISKNIFTTLKTLLLLRGLFYVWSCQLRKTIIFKTAAWRKEENFVAFLSLLLLHWSQSCFTRDERWLSGSSANLKAFKELKRFFSNHNPLSEHSFLMMGDHHTYTCMDDKFTKFTKTNN